MAISLKELPGPKGYPIVGSLPDMDLHNLHRQFENWADEYGDVYRLKLGYTSQTVITRPSLIQKICADRPDDFVRMKKMDNIIREGGVHGVFNAEGDEWRLHRKIVAKGLDVRHQKEFYPAMVKVLERLYNKWSREAEKGEPFDIQKDLFRFTVDNTSTLAFGVEMNTLEQEGSAIQDHMEKVFPMIFKRINQPIPWHKIVKQKEDRAFDRAVEEMNKLVDQFIEAGKQRIAEHPELKENPSNLLESILVAAEEEGTFTQQQVRGNLLTLLMAGEDTTATSLSWLIYLLTQHTHIQQGLQKEADEVLGENRFLTHYDNHAKLRYTEAVAFESMRFKPVAPVMLFQATRDLELEELFVKKGQKLLTNWRHAALLDQNFTNAQQFNPDRWLKESKCPVHNMEAFTPFGSGPRFCPGRNLAILQIRMVLSMLFRNFDVEMVTNHEDVREIMAFTMMASDYKVRLKKRSDLS